MKKMCASLLLIAVMALAAGSLHFKKQITQSGSPPAGVNPDVPTLPTINKEEVETLPSTTAFNKGSDEDVLESIVKEINELEANLGRSGLVSKARARTLTDDEGRVLASRMNEVLELRERELSIRIRRLQARLEKK